LKESYYKKSEEIVAIIIISVGNELLNGKTINSNATYISGSLYEVGIPTKKIFTIGDSVKDIKDAVFHALKEAQIVILTGGLGPTHDDITKNTVADFFGSKLVLNVEVLNKIEERFRRRGMKMPTTNRIQAMIPENTILVDNPVGTAPGIIFEIDEKYIILLPGVPIEMKELMDQSIVPFLKEKHFSEEIEVHLYRTTGIAESQIYQKCRDLMKAHSSYEIAFLPKYTGVEIRISLRKDDLKEREKYLKFEKKIYERVGDYIYSKSLKELEDVIGEILKQQGLTISIAESCTGGLIQDRITNTPGSSAYFMGGITTYSDLAKIKFLNINPETLKRKGAVSEEVAKEMAIGARKNFETDIALSSTGIAGPTGATPGKPVGLAYVGFASKGLAKAKKFLFASDRRINKERNTQAALDMLRRELLGLPSGAS
jgi:nicotinamide-nucleotide amidase